MQNRGNRQAQTEGTAKKLPSIPAIVTEGTSPVGQDRTAPARELRQGLRPDPNHPRLDIPPPSSVYSQEISPPDSPRTKDDARSSSPNVSPITDGGSASRGHGSAPRSTVSNIPLPSQQASGGTTAYIAGWRDKIAAGQAAGKRDSRRTKWDFYSGEPTENERGRHGQTSPGTVPFDGEDMGHSTTITGGQPASPKPNLFAQTLRKVGRKEVMTPPPREEWKGASGRESIVPPVADKSQPKPKLPTPSQRRKQQGIKQGQGLRSALGGRSSPASAKESSTKASPVQGPVKATSSARESPAPEENSLAAGQMQELVDTEGQAFPPRIDSYRKPDTSVHHPTPLLLPRKETQQVSEFEYSRAPNNDLAQNLPTSPVAASETMRQIPDSTNASQFPDPSVISDFEQLGLHDEPGSRFSVTTYATTIPDSPPQTPDMSQPKPLSATPSILNRKRPVASSSGTFPARPMSRKPTPSQLMDQDKKPMPPPPEDAEPVDKVTLLEAKLNSLHKRRANITTVINELTNVAQPSAVSYDIASRSEIKKTVNGLTTEQAQIAKEIHDTGLQLHRALKKRDQETQFEPTGLWVRRVTE